MCFCVCVYVITNVYTRVENERHIGYVCLYVCMLEMYMRMILNRLENEAYRVYVCLYVYVRKITFIIP